MGQSIRERKSVELVTSSESAISGICQLTIKRWAVIFLATFVEHARNWGTLCRPGEAR